VESLEDLRAEVQELVWTLVNEQATPEQISRLEELLANHEEARQAYVMCIQMHADLQCLFNEDLRNLIPSLKNPESSPLFGKIPLN